MNSPVKKLVWLASYPKSGNTWFRALLTAVLEEKNSVDINNLLINHDYADRAIFEYFTGLNSHELKEDEIDELRTEVFSYLSEVSEDVQFIKIHAGYHYLKNKKPNIPIDCSRQVLYLIRSPLDIAVSFAFHNNWSKDKMIKYLNSDYIMSRSIGFATPKLHEQLGSWSSHVSSWIYNKDIRVDVVRYEDMVRDPMETFGKALDVLNLKVSDEVLRNAIAACSFEKLRAQETKSPFKEKNPASSRFFREGKVGSWKRELTESQSARIITDHWEIMQKFGYFSREHIPKC